MQELPENYNLIFEVDLQNDKRLLILINTIALVIALIMAVLIHFRISIFTLFDMEYGMGTYIIKFVVLVIGLILYIILHECVHGVAMKLCGTKKINYGFTGIYAFAGSDDYYSKKSYFFIALAPVVFWGFVLLFLCMFVSAAWFWVVYIIQIANISGAAGDFYVTYKFSKFPKDILINDNGVKMTVFSKLS